MTNKTAPEMPVEIWAELNTKGPTGITGGAWSSEALDEFDTPYTRTDAIPTRAEVAREFYEAVDKLAGEKMLRTGVVAGAHYAAMQQVLKEWEDAE